MGLNVLSTLQNLGKIAEKGKGVIAQAGEKTGTQQVMANVLKTSEKAGVIVGTRTPILRSAGATVKRGFNVLGASTPQEVGQLLAGTGKLKIGGAIVKTGISAAEKNLVTLGLKSSSGALTKKGLQVLRTDAINTLPKATALALKKSGMTTAKGTLTATARKELLIAPAKTGRKQIENYILSVAGKGSTKTVSQSAEKALLSAIVKKTENTGISSFTKLLGAGILGAGAVTVPAVAYIAGRQQGAIENQESLLKEAELYEQGQADVYSTIDSQQGEDVPFNETYDYPLFNGSEGASLADPAYFPNYGYSAPYGEIVGNDLLDSGSNPLVLADYSNTPDEVQDIDMSVYGLENNELGSQVILEALPEDLQMTEFDDSLIEEDSTDIIQMNDLPTGEQEEEL
jgi:hypothetical protein